MKFLAWFLFAAIVSSMPAAISVAADAPAVPSFVTDLTTDYMNGNWDAVESSLKVHAKEIAAIPPAQRGDVTIISTALAECHPSWWKLCKVGKKFAFHPIVWNRRLDADYLPTGSGCQLTNTDGDMHFDLSWNAADLDSPARAEHGFTKGELAELGVWMTLGNADAWTVIPLSALQDTSEANRIAMTRYVDFRACLTGAYYGSPRSRRWALFLYLNTYQSKYNKMPTQISREAVGAMFIQELLANSARYPSIKLPAASPAGDTEEKCAAAIRNWIEKHPWTLAEDQSIRDALKQFALTNSATAWKSAIVVLPNKLTVALDPEKDKPLALKRDDWIKEKPQKSMPDQ